MSTRSLTRLLLLIAPAWECLVMTAQNLSARWSASGNTQYPGRVSPSMCSGVSGATFGPATHHGADHDVDVEPGVRLGAQPSLDVDP